MFWIESMDKCIYMIIIITNNLQAVIFMVLLSLMIRNHPLTLSIIFILLGLSVESQSQPYHLESI